MDRLVVIVGVATGATAGARARRCRPSVDAPIVAGNLLSAKLEGKKYSCDEGVLE